MKLTAVEAREKIERVLKAQDINLDVDTFVSIYSLNRGIKDNAVNVWRNMEKWQFDLPGNKKYLMNVITDSLNFLKENPKEG